MYFTRNVKSSLFGWQHRRSIKLSAKPVLYTSVGSRTVWVVPAFILISIPKRKLPFSLGRETLTGPCCICRRRIPVDVNDGMPDFIVGGPVAPPIAQVVRNSEPVNHC